MSEFFSPGELRGLTSGRALPFDRKWFEQDTSDIYIYGSGCMGVYIRDHLSAIPGVKARIKGFLDSNPSRIGERIENLEILAAGDFRLHPDRCLVVLAVNSRAGLEEMEAMCRSKDYRFVRFNRIRLLLEPPVDANRLETDPGPRSALSLWADAESAAVYRARIRLLATRDEADIVCANHEEQYFPPFMPASKYGFFADVGAFDGDTLACYKRRIGDIPGHYYAFEPDSGNYSRLCRFAGEEKRFTAFNLAIGAGENRPRFVDPETRRLVSTVALDSVLDGREVSFIKMDIEGAEMAALRGAEKIIGVQRPALAICVYHQPEDLWTIPRWLRAAMPEACLYLRHYSMYQNETVCYAVP